MYRRSVARRYQSTSQGNPNDERLRIRKRQQRMYHPNGKLNISGCLGLAWDEYRAVMTVVGISIATGICYNTFIVTMQKKNTRALHEHDKERTEYLKSTGKYRDERYTVRGYREIEDPDRYAIPWHDGPDVPPQKLFMFEHLAKGEAKNHT